jgi:8-oxo-dGTP pyrophosphatase MutT (NUDIX family)
LRNQGRTAGSWGIVGGKKEPLDSTPYQALEREIKEEIGKSPTIKKVIPLELFTSEDQHFFYNTYVLLVDKEFIPILNEEHVGYAWCDYGRWPKPLHQGVKRSLSNKTNKTKIELLLEMLS